MCCVVKKQNKEDGCKRECMCVCVCVCLDKVHILDNMEGDAELLRRLCC